MALVFLSHQKLTVPKTNTTNIW